MDEILEFYHSNESYRAYEFVNEILKCVHSNDS